MFEDDGFSTVDGFIEVNESLAEMIKYVANESSVGLYYVQQHTHNAIPNLLNLKDRVVDRSHETTLHTEDLEESIVMVRSMKDCGVSIADEMVKDIKKSLTIMSTSKQKRGLIGDWSSGYQMGKRSSSWGTLAFGQSVGLSQQEGVSSSTYISTVLNSAKQRAVNIRWPQLDTKLSSDAKSEQVPCPIPSQPADAVVAAVSDLPVTEAEELPLSSQIIEEQPEEAIPSDASSLRQDLSLALENYEEFKANRVAKLEEWLEERDNSVKCKESKSKGLDLRLMLDVCVFIVLHVISFAKKRFYHNEKICKRCRSMEPCRRKIII